MDPIEACARAAYEANRAFASVHGEWSPLSWDEAPEWQKTPTMDGVRGALNGSTPEESHVAWFISKRADGWKYGPVKDPVKKEHPCCLPYDQLPPEQRAKDLLYIRVVRAMGEVLGLPMLPMPTPEEYPEGFGRPKIDV